MTKKITEFFELFPRYDSRKSFYGKAHVIVYADGSADLLSYDTIVAHIDTEGNYIDEGKFSQTTTRHQKEFYRQFARR